MIDLIEKTIQAEWKIILYRNVIKDPLVQNFLALLKELTRTIPVPSQVLPSYYNFAAAFIDRVSSLADEGGNSWKDYLLHLILLDENLFSIQAEAHDYLDIPASLRNMAARDMAELQKLASVSNLLIRKIVAEKIGNSPEIENLPDWDSVCLPKAQENTRPEYRQIRRVFENAPQWETQTPVVAEYYRKNGVGQFGRFYAFRWVKNGLTGELTGVKHLDPIQLRHLYEYELEQGKVIQNTEQFLLGYAANNVLLYGDRGTGKSSTVKALVNTYGHRGLRLVEVRKQDLGDFPQVVSMLAQRHQRFILFIDDLSFSEQEGQYCELKALLEGGLEAKPDNVLVYATSNRRHLIQESFSDRAVIGFDPERDDVRHMDTMEEKLSLADRFGITVTFIAPDKKRYLSIVDKLALEKGLDIPQEELHQRAIKWEMSFNARSARTAKQFIDHLEGQLAMEKGQSIQEFIC